jgi:large subunit ribosomal protein L5
MADEIKKEAVKAAPAAKKAPVKEAKAAKAAPAPKTEEKKEEKPAVKTTQKGCAKPAVVSRVKVDYQNRVIPLLSKQFGYTSPFACPKLIKIVINMGVGEATTNAKEIEDAVSDLTLISGQKPVVTKAKKAIANFKLREGQPIGCKVTLRGLRMYDFFDKLVSIDLPRVRDFHGVPTNSFDGRGNYALGVKEQLIFPEIDYDKISHLRGMDIIIVTSAETDKEAYALLEAMGMPFARKDA